MSFPARFSRTQTPHALQSSFDLKDSAEDNNDNLFESLNNNNNNNNSSSSNQDEDEEEAREQGREQSDTIIHLNKPSGPPSSALPRFSFLSAPTAPVPAAATTQAPGDSFALLADKTSKRVRVTDPATSSSLSSQNNNSRRLSRGSSPILLDVDTDYTPATSSPSKRVRFDESRNQIHWHHRSSSISPSGSPPAINLKAQPSASALLRRSSSYQQSPSSSFDFDESFTSVSSSSSSNTGHLSPEKFTMSLENTSQDVLDFASSLTRLMGGGGASILGSQDSDTSSTSTSNPISNSFAFNGPMLPSSASSRIFSSMFQASPPSPVRPSFMSYSPPPSSSLSSCWSPTINDNEDEDDSMETAKRISPPPPPVSVQKKTRAPFVPRRPRNTGNLSPTRPGGVAPAVPRRFPSMLKREASNASFLDNYPASLAPEADENDKPFPFPVTRISPPPAAAIATVATVTVPIVPRMLTPPREASVSPVLPSPLALSSFNTAPTPVSLSLLSSSATNTTPLLRKSISDIPLRALNNITNKRNESNNNLWLDAQKIVPQFKKSASFSNLMDSPSSISKITLSQEDVIMTLAPLFPLQASSSSAVPNSLKML
ncbi:hypothetical protein BGX24_005733 [Mortierella sp. AD032]|nr:hypothetical protein BGX24_005733 [Mortierella sp. AD032]